MSDVASAPMTVLALATAEGVAFITAGGTLLAAIVLGGWAVRSAESRQKTLLADEGKRQQKRLDDEGKRQQARLDADAKPQERELDARSKEQQRQLAHAREVADLDDLRKLLDEAAVALSAALDASADLSVKVSEHGSSLRPEARNELSEERRRLTGLLARLQVRLGSEHPISRYVNDCVDDLESGHARTRRVSYRARQAPRRLSGGVRAVPGSARCFSGCGGRSRGYGHAK